MVKEKGKNKKNIPKSNWDEDDVSVATRNVLVDKKKKKSGNANDNLVPAAGKIAKDKKIKKKLVNKGAKKSSNVDDDFGASLDKLKEIDPEFYKVMPILG